MWWTLLIVGLIAGVAIVLALGYVTLPTVLPTTSTSVLPPNLGLNPEDVDRIARIIEVKLNQSLTSSFNLLRDHIQKQLSGIPRK